MKPVSVKYILNNSALVKFQNILLNSRRVRALSLAIMTGDAGNAFTGALTLFEKVLLPFLYFPALMAGGKRASNESGGGGKAKVCSFNISTHNFLEREQRTISR